MYKVQSNGATTHPVCVSWAGTLRLNIESVFFEMYSSTSKYRHHIGGTVDGAFEKVKQVFEQNFHDGWESQGAAFAAFWKGRKIIDIWGGYADRECLCLWEEDTMSLCFSSTKAVCALCFAMLVDRGLVSFEDLVTKYWPEYGQNGKETTTVRMLLTHQAGLPYIEGTIEIEDIKDHKRMGELLSIQKPLWAPGAKTGYHALTLCWLIDQLFRRIDPKMRGVTQFFREEIADPHAIDFFIGLPKIEQMRVARLKNTTTEEMLREVVHDPRILKNTMDGFVPEKESTFFRQLDQVTVLGYNLERFNDPSVRALEIPAAGGISTARDLAKIFLLVEQGKLLKKETIEIIRQPVNIDFEDVCFSTIHSNGHGFFHHKNRTHGDTGVHFKDSELLEWISVLNTGQWVLGHDGVGGQNVRLDLENELCFAYLTNSLKLGPDHLAGTFARLHEALYDCIEQESK